MSKTDVLPELKELMGAMFFAARKPLTADDIRRVLVQVAEEEGGARAAFGSLKRKDIEAAIAVLQRDFGSSALGLQLTAVGNGYRLENMPACGPWLRRLLEKGKPSRLSRPALETLAIIAYRQPTTRAEIETVRGVAVDQIVKNLLELQLVRVVGRSELPGRPWLFGTTQRFLEQFGLKGIDDLPSAHELRKLGEMKPIGKKDVDDTTPQADEELEPVEPDPPSAPPEPTEISPDVEEQEEGEPVPAASASPEEESDRSSRIDLADEEERLS